MLLKMKFFILLALFVFLPLMLNAQDTKDIRLKNAYATNNELSISGTNNNNKTITIHLAGIEFISKDTNIVKIALNDLINNSLVICKPIKSHSSKTIAQCLNNAEQDIALMLINSGFAITDRSNINATNFKSIYINAEYEARRSKTGFWASINQSTTSNNITKPSNILDNERFYWIASLLILGPFIGMLIVGVIIYGGFKRLINLQKYQIALNNKKDRALRDREKFIVAASMEGENNTNRAKLEAFIIIYEDLLKNLRDTTIEPKYKKSGDIIHEAPSLSRNVYESNMDKIDLLGISLVSDISVLYMDIDPNPNYRTFEPETPIEEVIEFVASIIKKAEAMLDPMDKIHGGLNVIIRNKKK